jgi:hypothetical protein
LKQLAAHAIAQFHLSHATFHFNSIQTSSTLPHGVYFKELDVKTLSWIVARRIRAAAAVYVHTSSDFLSSVLI